MSTFGEYLADCVLKYCPLKVHLNFCGKNLFLKGTMGEVHARTGAISFEEKGLPTPWDKIICLQ